MPILLLVVIVLGLGGFFAARILSQGNGGDVTMSPVVAPQGNGDDDSKRAAQVDSPSDGVEEADGPSISRFATDADSIVVQAEAFSERIDGSGPYVSMRWRRNLGFRGHGGDGAMIAQPATGMIDGQALLHAPRLDYLIELQGDRSLRLELRQLAPNVSSAAVMVAIDERVVAEAVQPSSSGFWQWTTAAEVELSSGSHTISVLMRDGGALVDAWRMSTVTTEPAPPESGDVPTDPIPAPVAFQSDSENNPVPAALAEPDAVIRASADTFVIYQDDAAHGSGHILDSKFAGLRNQHTRYTLLKFPLAETQEIVEAQLEIVVQKIYAGSNMTLLVSAITDDDWSEDIVWSQRPAGTETGAVLGGIQLDASMSDERVRVDVSEFVRDRQLQGKNVSFALRGGRDSATGVWIHSRIHEEHYPRLLVDYGDDGADEQEQPPDQRPRDDREAEAADPVERIDAGLARRVVAAFEAGDIGTARQVANGTPLEPAVTAALAALADMPALLLRRADDPVLLRSEVDIGFATLRVERVATDALILTDGRSQMQIPWDRVTLAQHVQLASRLERTDMPDADRDQVRLVAAIGERPQVTGDNVHLANLARMWAVSERKAEESEATEQGSVDEADAEGATVSPSDEVQSDGSS